MAPRSPIVLPRPRPTGGQEKASPERLRVTMNNRRVIDYPHAVDTFCDVLQILKFERVNAIEPGIVSNTPFPNRKHRQIGEYWINTNNGSRPKKKILDRIAQKLGMQLHVEVIPK